MVGAIIAAAISAIASGVGTHLANKKKKEAQDAYEDGINKEIGEIDKEIATNYLDRADSRNAIRQVTDATEESMRQLNTDAIRSGATDEAKVAMASKLNKNIANTVGNLAAVGEQYKDNLRNQRRSLRLGLLNNAYNTNSDTSGIATAMEGISSAARSIGSTVGTKSNDGGEVSPQTAAAIRGAKQAVDAGDEWATPVAGVINGLNLEEFDVNDIFGGQKRYGLTL